VRKRLKAGKFQIQHIEKIIFPKYRRAFRGLFFAVVCMARLA
jgi:hypothetical protein